LSPQKDKIKIWLNVGRDPKGHAKMQKLYLKFRKLSTGKSIKCPKDYK
jgi:hypothetical protein